jgi:glucosamine 6-phosphate synthetase-like amidotransferase/phosphosugar isomerase protein
MSVETPMISRKQLKSLAREIKANLADQFGVVSYLADGPLSIAVMKAIGDNPVFILQEIVASVIKEVVDEDTKFDFSSDQLSFLDYGEKWIKLPESQTVQVRRASLDHLLIQERLVIEDNIRRMKAYINHHEKLLIPLIRTMRQHGFETAGEAIALLQG